MGKLSTYIAKAFTIVMVWMVFVLSTQMERDMVPVKRYTAPTIAHISKPGRSVASLTHAPIKQNPSKGHKNTRKMHIAKHITIKLAVPSTDEDYHISLLASISYTPSLPDAYRFLYSRDINPPPPKSIMS